MFCKCGGILLVVRVEEPPKDLSKQEKLIYNRVCDVECADCGNIYYSQPFDTGKRMNIVKKFEQKKGNIFANSDKKFELSALEQLSKIIGEGTPAQE